MPSGKLRSRDVKPIIDVRSVPMMIVGAVVAGLIAAVFAYAASRRQTEIDHLNQQIDTLYKPLLTKIVINGDDYDQFCSENCPNDRAFFDGTEPESERDVRKWRDYIRGSALPQLKSMTELIEHNANLVTGSGALPRVFSDLSKHRSQYETLEQGWAERSQPLCTPGEEKCENLTQSANTSSTPWPENIEKCVSEDLGTLQHAKAELASKIFMFVKPEIQRSRFCD